MNQPRGQGQREGTSGMETGSRSMQRTGPTGMSRRREFLPGWGGGPFTTMRRLADEMDRMFDQFTGGLMGVGSPGMMRGLGGETGMMPMWMPQVEMFERENQLVIRTDLPGLNREDVNIRVEGESLIIEGERKREHEEKHEGFYRSERSYGNFFRAIPLPEDVDAEQARANFRNGVLEVTLPIRPEQRRGRQIQIEEGETRH